MYGVFCNDELLATYTDVAIAQEEVVYYERSCALSSPNEIQSHTVKIITTTQTLEVS